MDDVRLRECLQFVAELLKIHQLAIEQSLRTNQAVIELIEKLQPGFHDEVRVISERLKSEKGGEAYRAQFQRIVELLDALIERMSGPMH